MSVSGLGTTPAELFDAAERSLSKGDLTSFDQYVDRLLRIAPYWLEALLLAAASFEPRDLARAEILYSQALKTLPSSAAAAAGLVRCQAAQTGDIALALLKRMTALPHGRDLAATLLSLCRAQSWTAAGVAHQKGRHLKGVIAVTNGAAAIRRIRFKLAPDSAADTLGALLVETAASAGDFTADIQWDASKSAGDGELARFSAKAPKPGRYVAFLESDQPTITGLLLPATLSVKAAEATGEVWWSHASVVCGWLEGEEDICPEITVECDPPSEPLSISYAPLSYAGSDIGPERKLFGFAVLLPLERRRTRIDVGLHGHPLPGSPVHLTGPYNSALHASLRSFTVAPPDWHLLPRVQRSFSDHDASAQPIDVIVPVYRGHAETQRCIESVRSSRNNRAYHLVIINDASPTPSLAVYLRTLAGEAGVTLIEHARNRGFVATVNAGMCVHPDRDVILLNSDTQVTDGWLDRLNAAANDSNDIATVTPLSNSATILSYPSMEQSNPLPPPPELAALDVIFAKGREVPLEIPTAVGFCMFIRRACLDDAGLFDEVNFGRGYGEENEFCLRASARGWRHVCATNLLVGHQGSVSFGDEFAAVQRQRLEAIAGAFPGYGRYIERFVRADPLLAVRRAADIERLADQAQPGFLMVVPQLTGGTAEHVDTMCRRLTEEGVRCFILTAVRDHPKQQPRARLKVHGEEKEFPNLLFELPFDLDLLIQSLRRMGVRHVHVHHFLTLPWPLTTIAEHLGLPFDVTVHDYGWACPRVTMVGVTGRYCGEPDIAACESCIALAGNRLEEDIGVQALRARSRRFLAAARRVFVPSADVGARLHRYFPEAAISVRPHPAPAALGVSSTSVETDGATIAIVGAINADKGYDVLLACAQDAALRSLPLHFVVIGFTQDDDPLLRTGRVAVTGRFDPDELPALIRRRNPAAGWVPSICPETWSLALSHILLAGLWPIAFDIGSPAARIRALGAGDLIPLGAQALDINDRLVAALARAPHITQPRDDAGAYGRLREDYYGLPPDPTQGVTSPVPLAGSPQRAGGRVLRQAAGCRSVSADAMPAAKPQRRAKRGSLEF